jgi:magnesium chelatase subunit D
MVKEIPNTDHPLDRGLICAALNDNLRSILVFDASIETLNSAAQRLKLMLERMRQQNVTIVQLGVIGTEEDLWGSLTFRNSKLGNDFEWKSGLLASGRGDELRIVIIPDLTRLNLAVTRACVTLIGAEVAYLERHGQTDAWKPNLCWLAGCSGDPQQTGMLSPHLLDRFALRLSGQVAVKGDRFDRLEQSLQESEESAVKEELSPKLIDILDRAQSGLPRVLINARQRVLDYAVPTNRYYSVRRDLALLRLAQINALFAKSELNVTTAIHVDEAAQSIGLIPSSPNITGYRTAPMGEATPVEDKISVGIPKTVDGTGESLPPEIVHEPDTKEEFPFQQLTVLHSNPYPEDRSPVLREANSLRLPLRRFKNIQQGRGEIIGVEPTILLEDLAIVSTFLEVWKYQKSRRDALKKQGNSKEGLILLPTDLRRYRRAVVPVQMLAMAIDFTCLENCQWQAKLLPYLQWAYIERASACLIQIGTADPEDPLRAVKIASPSVLVPRLTRGLEEKQGKATPLAHGLLLMLQTLRHALQHGRSNAERVVLVVISDGRGNVPLAASQSGEIVAPVGRQGIEDALEVARQIGALQRIDAVVLNPQPDYYPDLPVELAQALGAKIAAMLPLEVWEVEEE